MRSVLALVAVASLALSALAVACGSGGEDDDGSTGDGTPAGTVTARSSAGSTTTGTPAADGTPAPGGTQPASTPGNQATLTPNDQTVVAEDNDIFGGSEDQPPVVVNPPPQVSPPAGRTPTADPPTIADPAPAGGQLRVIVDTNASQPGIQTSREVNVGDKIRVGVVVANAPGYNNNAGVLAMQFDLNYDKTKLFAQTISGGSAEDRNPDLNQQGLGGSEWQCLPAPEGDKDDPGGMNGDGNPATGQAFLSCFTTSTGPQGSFVFGTIEFTAIASGTVGLRLQYLVIGDSLAVNVAQCPGDGYEGAPEVPCEGASITIR